jgi:hypothetical protein
MWTRFWHLAACLLIGKIQTRQGQVLATSSVCHLCFCVHNHYLFFNTTIRGAWICVSSFGSSVFFFEFYLQTDFCCTNIFFIHLDMNPLSFNNLKFGHLLVSYPNCLNKIIP